MLSFTTARWYVNKGRNSTFKNASCHIPFPSFYMFTNSVTLIPILSVEGARVVYVPTVRGSNLFTESGIVISARSPKSFTGFCWFSHGAWWNDASKLAMTTSLYVPLNPLFTNTLHLNSYNNFRLFWHADIHSSSQETSRAISLPVVIWSYMLIFAARAPEHVTCPRLFILCIWRLSLPSTAWEPVVCHLTRNSTWRRCL